MAWFKSKKEDSDSLEDLKSMLSDRDAKIEALTTQVRLLSETLTAYEMKPPPVVEPVEVVSHKKPKEGKRE